MSDRGHWPWFPQDVVSLERTASIVVSQPPMRFAKAHQHPTTAALAAGRGVLAPILQCYGFMCSEGLQDSILVVVAPLSPKSCQHMLVIALVAIVVVCNATLFSALRTLGGKLPPPMAYLGAKAAMVVSSPCWSDCCC